MNKKIVYLFVLSLSFIFSMSFFYLPNVTASSMQDDWVSRHIEDYLEVLMSESGENESGRVDLHLIYDATQQVERLWSLFLRNQANVGESERMGSESVLPYIVMIATPEVGGQSTFMLAFDVMPTEEQIEYVVAYTGIPRERLCMGQMVIETQLLRIPYEELPARFKTDDINTSLVENVVQNDLFSL
ncbi:MAG: hypothetical protein FWC92_10630 [Defluviitaleaceae bacterium]|nr:hypothetical protein [Defluviitaleaceae bacterium]